MILIDGRHHADGRTTSILALGLRSKQAYFCSTNLGLHVRDRLALQHFPHCVIVLDARGPYIWWENGRICKRRSNSMADAIMLACIRRQSSLRAFSFSAIGI